MPYTLFELAINLYEGILMIYFMRQRLTSDRKCPLWIDAVFCMLITISLSAYTFFDIDIPDTWVFIVPLLYAFATHRGTLLSKLLCTLALGLVFTLLVGLIPKLYLALGHIDLDTVLQSTPQRVGCVISYNLALTIAVFALANTGKTYNKLIPNLFITFVCAILFFQFAATELIFSMQESTSPDKYLIITYTCLLLSAIAVFAFYEAISSYSMKKHSRIMLEADEEKAKRHSAEMMAYYKRMLVLQHDLHNQINSASRLTNSANPNAYEKWLSELSCLIDERNPFMTGNMAIDAIITAKRIVAQQQKIAFDFEPHPLPQTPIEEVEFCTLLSNIIDNAIEGAMRARKTESNEIFVKLKLNQTWDMYYVKCENSCDPNTVIKTGDDFLSTKNSSGIHGLGTKSIKQTVSDHDGVCTFSISESVFTVSVVLPVEKVV